LRVEEVLITSRDSNRGGVESRRARQCKEQPCDFVTAAVTALPNILDAVNVLEFLPTLLLFCFVTLKRQVANLLGTRLDLLQLDFLTVAGGDNFPDCVRHGTAFIGEQLHPAIESLGFLLPEFVSVFFQVS